MHSSFKARQGFTLLELCVVLIIIGLITGAIVVGKSLIRSAAVQSVVSDFQTYQSAISAFETKYSALPGDMANATSYWGSASGGCPNGTGTGTQTCNGDGNGQIAAPVTYPYESYRMWQHLSNAGLINGSFTGSMPYPPAAMSVPGINIPKSKISQAGFHLYWSGGVVANGGGWFGGTYKHMMEFGASNYFSPFGFMTSYSDVSAPVLTAGEAQNIDVKSDDGLPGTGFIRSYSNAYYSCSTSQDPSTATYAVSTPGNICSLIFITGF